MKINFLRYLSDPFYRNMVANVKSELPTNRKWAYEEIDEALKYAKEGDWENFDIERKFLYDQLNRWGEEIRMAEKFKEYLEKGTEESLKDKIWDKEADDFVFESKIRKLEEDSVAVEDLNAPISFGLLVRTAANYFDRVGKFPKVIYLSVTQYLEYPYLLMNEDKSRRYKWRGIELRPIRTIRRR